mgnify:CR=1 FL=1
MIASAIVRRAAALAARITYRDIEVLTRDLPGDGPVLAVSNHFGGAADGILLVYLSDRMPRIVVRDVLLRVPIAGSIMRSIGAIAVHKADDASGDASTNDIMFRSCYQALADGSLVLIFPEGVTQDDPYLAPVKTGAARIALGARASGVEKIKILPIGIHYEDKATFRSRVLIVAGAPLDLDELAPELDRGREPLTADNRNAVVALTELIDQTMRSVGPVYQDWEQALDLQLASSTVMRSARRGYASTLANVPLALTEQLAERLAQRPAAARERICSSRPRLPGIFSGSASNRQRSRRRWSCGLTSARGTHRALNPLTRSLCHRRRNRGGDPLPHRPEHPPHPTRAGRSRNNSPTGGALGIRHRMGMAIHQRGLG